MCLCPVSVVVRDFYGNRRSMDVPCGKCVECVIRYQNMWKCRLIEEDRKWPFCYFFTLTYSDDCLPTVVDSDTGEVLSSACKKDVQSWLKRFRQRVVRRKAKERGIFCKDITHGQYKFLKPKFSYFICAEYGPNGTHRPHYHGLLFTDLPYRYVSMLIGDWRVRFGFVNLKRVKAKNNSSSKVSAPANYVSKYCCKGEFSSRVEDIEVGLIEPAWRIMSKRIGDNYVERNRNYHKPPRRFYKSTEDYIAACVDRCFYFDGEYKYSLPRYWKERIFYNLVSYSQIYYDKKSKCCKVRQAKRYAARNEISARMQALVRDRIDQDYLERFALVKSLYPSWSDTEIDLHLLALEEDSRKARKSFKLGKLNKFYLENKLKFKML